MAVSAADARIIDPIALARVQPEEQDEYRVAVGAYSDAKTSLQASSKSNLRGSGGVHSEALA